ncbi:arylsulfatase B [Ancylobacter rudongensis]|uniref:Arylsulfatase A n=1 Tax=Ancylobacter rudongensis TaxID=177413 RepID=A0A1G4T0M6_9HYPH|nr:Arylsulfatase A [Ancylobacter rudongensis]
MTHPEIHAMPERPAEPSRREVLAGSASLLAAVSGLPLFATGAWAQGTQVGGTGGPPRPHILYIMADDLGSADVGFRGSDIKTPNLDALAAGGAALGHFYTQPMCTPTRAALMTGRYPLRYGLQTAVIPSGGDYGLATDEFLLPQALKEVGYRTALVGKWHLGHADRKYWPCQRGFDRFYGPLLGEIDHFKHQAHGVTDWYRDNEMVVEDGYDTELLGAEAVRLIAEQDPKTPLFLYLAFTAPHTPFQAPQTYIDMYASIDDPQRRTYAAMITAMDDQIGKVVKALEARGLRENTLIVFHSDNGGTRNKKFVGEGDVSGDLPASNVPLRDGKGTLYEGGTRVVALANWPGRITPGTSPGVMHVVDMLPTLAGLAGAGLGHSKRLDGIDMWPTLAAGQAGRDEVVYNVEPSQGAVREGDWKLVWKVDLPPKVELFDLSTDPTETSDIAEAHPDKVAALTARVLNLARAMAEPLQPATAHRLTLSAPPTTPR